MPQYGIKMCFAFDIAGLYFFYKTLHENTIDAVVFHPLEVEIDAFFIVRAIQWCYRAVGKLNGAGIGFGVFGHVGPEIDARAAGLEAAAGAVLIMVPTAVGGVAVGGEPA